MTARPLPLMTTLVAVGVVGDPEVEMPYVMDSVRLIRKTLNGRVPLIGFAGAALMKQQKPL